VACPRCGFALPSDAQRGPTCGLGTQAQTPADAYALPPADAHGQAAAEPLGVPRASGSFASQVGPPYRQAPFAGRGRTVAPPQPVHGLSVAVVSMLGVWCVVEIVSAMVSLIRVHDQRSH